jgi:trans-aconitate 2-methyltransferase
LAWDPKTYLAFGAQRTRPAAELLARVTAEAPARVVDLGCGPGNSTALLAARWPRAALEGVDSSPEMLADAARSGITASWHEADIATWTPRERYDVIFSNATYQWVPDHKALLPRLMSFVVAGGTLVFQVPRNFDDPCHTLIHKIAKEGPWASKLKGVRDWWNVLEPAAYFRILEGNAAAIDIWETRYVQVLEGEDAVYRWMTGTGLRPFANALEGKEREDFLDEYRRRVGAAYPPEKSGVTLYPFTRLFCVARK